MENKKGIFYSVGVGPGDPELMTLKAVRIVEACPVIAVPQTRQGGTMAMDIAAQVVDLSGKTVIPLRFEMARDRERMVSAHEAAAAQVEEQLAGGRDVAMLNIGDVSIFATCSYLMERLGDKGYESVMIPGITSFCAVAARLGISLTTMNEPLHIVPAGGGSLEETLSMPGTKVLMKSASKMPQVIESLRARGLLAKCAMVQNCGLPDEKVYETLENVPKDSSYFSIIVVKE